MNYNPQEENVFQKNTDKTAEFSDSNSTALMTDKTAVNHFTLGSLFPSKSNMKETEEKRTLHRNFTASSVSYL